MPDIQTALQSALKQWEEPKEQTVRTQPTQTSDPKPYFTVTNNVSRVTFEFVRDNSPKTNKEICDALEQQGFKRTSVSSLLGQMVLAGLLKRDDLGKYWALVSEYRSFSTYTLRKAQGKTKSRNLLKKPVAQTRAMKNYLPKQEAPAPVQAQPEVKICNSVDDLLNTLTVIQARELFDRLKKMFA